MNFHNIYLGQGLSNSVTYGTAAGFHGKSFEAQGFGRNRAKSGLPPIAHARWIGDFGRRSPKIGLGSFRIFYFFLIWVPGASRNY